MLDTAVVKGTWTVVDLAVWKLIQVSDIYNTLQVAVPKLVLEP